jgi:hypothetical protein
VCIMEVLPGQHSATIAQAMAHNTSTLDRDLEMFIELLRARAKHDPEATVVLDSVLSAQAQVHKAYAQLLTVFGEEVAHLVADPNGHLHLHDHGSERSLVEEAHHDAQLARKFMTR